ncbi:MAG: alpha/beta hydrolase [Opitutales bacterium]|jgi:acetyl esterase/lipase
MKLCAFAALLLAPLVAAATNTTLLDSQVIRLWPGDAPLAQGNNTMLDIPALTAFLPAPGEATGSAIIVCPGGGYTHLSLKREGSVIGTWLANNGVTAFVLKYRLGPKYHYPAEFDDVERALRYVRFNAPAWNLDPHRIGIMGFSAGGHLASLAATHSTPGDPKATDPIERVSSRPDLQILLYPVITFTDEPNVHKGSRAALLGPNPPPDVLLLLSSEKQVTQDTPRAFLVHSTSDHTVPVANSDAYAAALAKLNIPVVYLRGPYGGHGFGLTDAWSGQCIAWLHANKF